MREIARLEIARLERRRDRERQHLAAAHCREPDLAHRLDLVASVPGIGERTALAVVVRMPELGRISREPAAALAGLAPFDDDRGKVVEPATSPTAEVGCDAPSLSQPSRPPSAGTRPSKRSTPD